MGIYDRDYFRGESGVPHIQKGSLVLQLLIANAAVFVITVLFGHDLKLYLTCSANDIFAKGHVWRLLTANFAHSDGMHLLFNMFGLFIFGRDLEEMYGKRNFFTLYMVSGVLAVFAEILVQQLTGFPHRPVLGASGSVLALLMVYASVFSQRQLLLFFVIPVRMWVIVAIVLGFDVLGFLASVIGMVETQTAHTAHLAGAAFGFAYRRFDLRLERILAPRPKTRRKVRSGQAAGQSERAPPEILRPFEAVQQAEPEPDPVSDRIDMLLEKISVSGMEALSAEERAFLEENSKKYKSR